ncbi:hypothetical protein PIB30_078775 [Stylosanthes scabra]|uniref:Reverse transcriptase zinc-binding domain-containing protein n=1 Tax=Stylosanthes scabra TaxID=79078 RepID=A0ABU6QQJ1_9FABA|nr:hypothetical protein [Stylosanthes scabra]
MNHRISSMNGSKKKGFGRHSGIYVAHQKSESFSRNSFMMALRLRNDYTIVDAVCPRCSAVPEYALHTLVLCLEVTGIWNHSSTASAIPRNEHLQPWQWWIELVAALHRQPNYSEQMTHMAYLIWLIWLDRNSMVFEGSKKSFEELLSQADTLAKESLHSHHHRRN